MRVALLLAAVVLVPAAAASGSSAPFTLGPTESVTVRLQLAEPATVSFALRFQVGSARDLTVDGPGACDLSTTATGMGSPGGAGATMGNVRCKLAAGTHSFQLSLGVGYVKGLLDSSHGRWT